MRTLLVLLLGLPTAAQTPIFTLDGSEDGQLYGRSVAVLGDHDGDGHDDFLVGVARDATVAGDAGAVQLISGADGMVVTTLYGDGEQDHYGWALEAAGDVNADGEVDFIIGAPGQCGTTQVGYARVHSGSDFGELFTVHGESFLDWFGCAVSAAGDQDLDGYADVAVGAHQFCAGFELKGYLNAYSGFDGSLRWRADGAMTWDTYAWDIDLLGDYDGDGKPDLLVGAPGSDAAGYDAGRFYILSGADGAELHVENGEAGLHYSGWAVAATGDHDLDGVVDYAIGVPGEQDAFFPADGVHPSEFGKLQIHSGKTNTVLFEEYGSEVFDHLGWTIATVGDLDLDGRPEVAAAATRYDIQSTGLSLGPAYIKVISSADGSEVMHIEGPATTENFQLDLAAGGDVNGDGTPDLILGSEGLTSTAGFVRVLSGRQLSLSSSTHTLGVSAVTEQDLAVDPEPALDGALYQVLGSLSGTSPGFFLGKAHIPLNPDVYLDYTLNPPSGGLLKHSSGVVGFGPNVATFKPSDPAAVSLIGTTVHHVVVLVDAVTGDVLEVSSPVPGTLLP